MAFFSSKAPAARRVIVLDTETTGLQPYDRMISLAALRFEGENFCGDLHRVYDPRKDSHPGALSVHGWDDWGLRFQDLFADDAEDVREWLAWADLLVMHNAAFDMRYVARELRKADAAPLDIETYCTLEAARSKWPGSAKLDDCLARISLRREGARHGAYEDAFLTACLYFHLQGAAFRPPAPARWPDPTNLRPAPPRPAGTLPRRTTKKRGAPRPVPAPENPPRVETIPAQALDGLLILRHIAEVGSTNETAQADILDAYLDYIAGGPEAPIDISSRGAMVEMARAISATEAEALAAAERLGTRRDDVVALGPLIVAMVKADGTATADEAAAVRKVIDTIRRSRGG